MLVMQRLSWDSLLTFILNLTKKMQNHTVALFLLLQKIVLTLLCAERIRKNNRILREYANRIVINYW